MYLTANTFFLESSVYRDAVLVVISYTLHLNLRADPVPYNDADELDRLLWYQRYNTFTSSPFTKVIFLATYLTGCGTTSNNSKILLN
jgi:hypothetical protein